MGESYCEVTLLHKPKLLPRKIGTSFMAFILAHDLGTTGNKANLFDETGALVAGHLEPYPVSYPQPQWAEQNPDDWWRAVCASTRALLRRVPHAREQIAAVTFSGQMMGVVAVDALKRPLRDAIIWADQRATTEANGIKEKIGADAVYRRTGHRISPAYTAAKILWIKQHQPELYAQTEKFLCAKDYAILRLTDTALTDFSDASGSTVFDLQARAWCDDWLETIGLDAARLPRTVASTTIAGEVTRAASEETGLRAGTPVVVGGGDGSCAAAGAGVIDAGECYCNLGTSAWISFSATAPLFDGHQRTMTFHHVHPERFTPIGVMQAAGGARDWLRNQIGEVDDEAIAAVPPGARGLTFLPYLIGERSPWWNPHARGAFVGLSASHSRADMARAALEGVTYNLRLILDALESQGTEIETIRVIGGGAKSAVWTQMLADALDKPMQLLELNAEASAWGAAVVGGIGAGVYDDWSIANAHTRVTRVLEPDADRAAHYKEGAARFEKVYRALEPLMQQPQAVGNFE